MNIKGVNDYPASSAAGKLGYLTVSEGAPGARGGRVMYINLKMKFQDFIILMLLHKLHIS